MKLADVHYRVCKDRTGDELKGLGFTFGLFRLDKRMAILQTIASDLKYAFSTTRKFAKTRYGDGGWPVLYTAEDPNTAIYEVAFHARREWLKAKRVCERRSARKLLYSLEFKTTHGERPIGHPSLTDPNDYSYCHEIARRARAAGFHFLIVPSVRNAGGICRPVFSRSCVEPLSGVESQFSVVWDVATDALGHTAGKDRIGIALSNP